MEQAPMLWSGRNGPAAFLLIEKIQCYMLQEMIHKIEKFIEANQAALEFFLACQKRSEKAQKYLGNRLSTETIKKYKLGYAPETGLINWLKHKKIGLFYTDRLGLTGASESGSPYQTFKTRIMVPIFHAGIVVGFGGRTLDPSKPKYINSRTSVLYHKNEVVYNLHLARRHIDRLGFAFLVEGYFDVLGLVDHGVLNAVATCGTAFSYQQAWLLKRYTNRVYTFFDGDEAGIIAAKKAKTVLKQTEMYKGRIVLPKGYDPDSFVKENGAKALKKLKVVF
jgi:DNA primase